MPPTKTTKTTKEVIEYCNRCEGDYELMLSLSPSDRHLIYLINMLEEENRRFRAARRSVLVPRNYYNNPGFLKCVFYR